jgi:hypothetical protein
LEANELGWKVDLSPKKERLVEHLSAFGNHEGGGFLIFGVSNRGVIQGIVDQAASAIVAKIACLTRLGWADAPFWPHSSITHPAGTRSGKINRAVFYSLRR